MVVSAAWSARWPIHVEFSGWRRAAEPRQLGRTLRPLRVEPPMAELPVHAVSSPSQPAPLQVVGAPMPARLTPQDVEAIARRVAELVTPRGDVGWATADELARRLAVRPGWIYRHAGELGGIKLGSAPNAPWRFDVEQALRSFADANRATGTGPAPPAPVKRGRPRRKAPERARTAPGTIGPVTVARATIRHSSDRPAAQQRSERMTLATQTPRAHARRLMARPRTDTCTGPGRACGS